jgi:hypothetical protein
MMSETKFQGGDIFVVRSKPLISKIVRLLTSIRYGIPYKDAHSHIEINVDGSRNISAEGSGVAMKDSNRHEKAGKAFTVYRLKKMDPEKQEKLKQVSEPYLGKGYAYARYALDFARIASFVVCVFALISALMGVVFSIESNRYIVLGAVVFFLVLTMAKPFLIKKDILTHDCSELTSLILVQIGLWVSLPKSRNEFPDGMKQVLDNLVMYGQAEIVLEMEEK